MRKAVIGTVHPGLIDAHFLACLVPTLTEDFEERLVSRMPFIASRAPAGMVHVARNAVVQQFLAHPLQPDYLVFIDTDMSWEPSDVWRLLDTARERRLPILGALASMQDGRPVMFDGQFSTIEPLGMVQRAFCCGAAFLAIRRDALEECAKVHPWPTPWFDYGAWNGKAVTEDVIFAQRMRDLSIPTHVDSRILLGHRKIQTLTASVPAGVT